MNKLSASPHKKKKTKIKKKQKKKRGWTDAFFLAPAPKKIQLAEKCGKEEVRKEKKMSAQSEKGAR